MLNLNLGSGTNRKQDFISVDLDPHADVIHDLTKPLPYLDESVDNIYSCHVIEHFSRDEWELIRKDWTRILKPNGKLEIICPDIIKVCKKFIADPYDTYSMMQIYGLQSNDGEYHKNGFFEQSLIDSFPTLIARPQFPTDNTDLHIIFIKPNDKNSIKFPKLPHKMHAFIGGDPDVSLA